MSNLTKINVARNIIENTNGLWFSVEFVKKDGSLRKMTCKTGVRNWVDSNGNQRTLAGGKNTKAAYVNYVNVYDTVAKDYRTINTETLKAFKCGDLKLSFS